MLIKKWNSLSLIVRILIGLVIGVILGLACPGLRWIRVLGTLFVGALKGIAPLLVFVLVASSLANAKGGNMSRFRAVIFLYLFSTLCAAVVAVLVNFAFPVTLSLTGMNADDLDSEDIVRCTLESASANITDHAVAPIFWIGLLGGAGGFVYRCVNIADRVGGRMGGYEDTSGRVPTAINKFFTFVPSRIAAKLCVADGSLLMLDSKNASQTVKRFAADSANRNAAQTQAACAGLLDISIDSGYPNSVTMTLGKETQTPGTTSIYWVNQLISGSSMFMLMLVAAVRVGLFFLMKYI